MWSLLNASFKSSKELISIVSIIRLLKYLNKLGLSCNKDITSIKSSLPLLLLPIIANPFSKTNLVLIGIWYSLTPNKEITPCGFKQLIKKVPKQLALGLWNVFGSV